VGFVQQGGRPFFLYLAPTAPHGPATPARVDKGRFADLVAAYPQPASVGEQDMSDKPLFLQGRVWDAKRQASADGFHERQLETIYSLDRQLQRVWDALPDNTVVIFTSDNGFLWGEHRWVGKRLPYNESIRVPMAIATKGMGMPLVYPDRIALNIDIRATLEGIAGLAPVTEGEDWGDPSWSRTQTLLEMWGPDQLMYCGLRTPTSLYVRWGTGEEELYDEVVDPLELDNLASSQPGALDAMRAKAAVPCTSGSVYPPGWPFPIQPAP
jgi:arylsulfatase A-like enzyme